MLNILDGCDAKVNHALRLFDTFLNTNQVLLIFILTQHAIPQLAHFLVEFLFGPCKAFIQKLFLSKECLGSLS
jgi:hypothetical protein